jgi:hypothetical protein
MRPVNTNSGTRAWYMFCISSPFHKDHHMISDLEKSINLWLQPRADILKKVNPMMIGTVCMNW